MALMRQKKKLLALRDKLAARVKRGLSVPSALSKRVRALEREITANDNWGRVYESAPARTTREDQG